MTSKVQSPCNVKTEGFVAPGFENVVQEFERNFAERGDKGAAFAAMHRGRQAVDVWAGEAAPGRLWRQDSLQIIFSGTNGLVAGCVLKLLEEGLLDLDAPIKRYWPEFAANNKERVLVRHVVSHRCGLPGLFEPLKAEDWADYERMERLLAAQPLTFDPNAYNC